MSESGQGRPDSFASTLKVQRSAAGSGSGRHETAPPMSQLGRERSARTGIRQSKFPRSKFLRKNLRKNPAKNFRKKSADRIPEKIRRTSRAPSEVANILEAGAPRSRG